MFYAFITVAGMVFASCPYQTPGSHILRYIFRHTLHYARQNLLPSLHSVPFVVSAGVLKFFTSIGGKSMIFDMFANSWSALEQPWYSVKNAGQVALFLFLVPFSLMTDCFLLGHAVYLLLTVDGRKAYRWSFSRVLDRRVMDTSPQSRGLDRQMVALPLRCVSWILQTSLEKTYAWKPWRISCRCPSSVTSTPPSFWIALTSLSAVSASIIAR